MTKLLTLLSLGFLACARAASGAIPVGAENVVPLSVGARAPDAEVKTVEGADFDLSRAFAGRPTILMFYRGGWCPYCNRQLGAMQEYERKFRDLGYQILAVCTDRPADLRASMDKHHLSYTVLSDREMAAAAAFHVAFRLSDEDARRYASHHIALPNIPGDPAAQWLPVPSIFVIGPDGRIKYVSFNPDFRVRPPPEEILAAAARVR